MVAVALVMNHFLLFCCVLCLLYVYYVMAISQKKFFVHGENFLFAFEGNRKAQKGLKLESLKFKLVNQKKLLSWCEVVLHYYIFRKRVLCIYISVAFKSCSNVFFDIVVV